MTQSSISVATYNVHGYVGADGRLRVGRTLNAIAQLGADIVGLQEAGRLEWRHDSADRDLGLMETHGYVLARGPTMVGPLGQVGNALLSRFPLRGVRSVRLSGRLGDEPRRALLADVEVSGRTIRVVVTHLSLRRDDRAKQALALEAYLDRPSVLLGDLNAWSSREPAMEIVSKACRYVSARASFPALCPLLPLDRIAVTAPLHLEAVRRPRAMIFRWASDHAPIAADVVLPAHMW